MRVHTIYHGMWVHTLSIPIPSVYGVSTYIPYVMVYMVYTMVVLMVVLMVATTT
jgi:hypothetical protein